jgi:putative cell wall-binding protein
MTGDRAGGGPTGVLHPRRPVVGAWRDRRARGGRVATWLPIAVVIGLGLAGLALFLALTLGSDTEDVAVDIALLGAGDVVAGEPSRIEVSVEVTELGALVAAHPVRLLGALTGDGAEAVGVSSVEGAGSVGVDLDDGRFLFPSADQRLTAGDLADGRVLPLELTLPEGHEGLALSVTLVSAQPVPAEVVRLLGGSRYETAVRVSEQTHPDGARTVYLTRAFAFADALAAGSAAAGEGAPLLLAFEGSLPVVTRAEIERLAPDRVVLVGGGAALSQEVAAELSELVGSVSRLAGTNRYDTAARVAVDAFDNPSTVLLTSGQTYDAALAAVSGAANERAPVLLTRRDGLPQPTRQALGRLAPDRVVVLGGPDVISTVVVQELGELVDDVQRIAGDDLYDSGIEIVEAFFDAGDADVVVLATDLDFHDALVGGPAAAALGAPMLLTQWNAVPPAVLDMLATLEPELIYVLGTPSGAVADDARAAATPAELTPDRVRTLGSGTTAALGDR